MNANNNNNNDNGDEPEPAPLEARMDLFELSQNVRPIANFQSQYLNFNDYDSVNYHSNVYLGTEDSDNTTAWLVLLKVGLPDGTITKTYRIDTKNKRQKIDTGERKYRRIYHFANLLSNGNVLVYLEMGSDDQETNLSYLDNCRIGDQFVAIEPDTTTNYISNSMPILKTDFQLIPSCLPPTMQLPSVDVPDVISLNTSKYFIVHNARLLMTGVNLVQTNCTAGNMCDLSSPKEKGCSCWRQHGRQYVDPEHVLKANVTVFYRDKMNMQKQLPRTTNWSSQHFTDLVFDRKLPLDPLAQNQDQVILTALRRKTKELVDYVNDAQEGTNGWTVIGWYRRSMRKDTAATAEAEDKVGTAKADVTMHLVRIYPTHITRTQLLAADRLLPARIFGPNANYATIRRENEEARSPQAR